MYCRRRCRFQQDVLQSLTCKHLQRRRAGMLLPLQLQFPVNHREFRRPVGSSVSFENV